MAHNQTGDETSRREFIDTAVPAAALVNILTGCGTTFDSTPNTSRMMSQVNTSSGGPWVTRLPDFITNTWSAYSAAMLKSCSTIATVLPCSWLS